MPFVISSSSRVSSTTNAFGVLERCEDSGASSAVKLSKKYDTGTVPCDATPILHRQGKNKKKPPLVALCRSTRFREPPRIPLDGYFIGPQHNLNKLMNDSSTSSPAIVENRKKIEEKIKMFSF